MSLFVNCPWCGAALAPTNTKCFSCGATLENGQLVSPGDSSMHQESEPAPAAVVTMPQPTPIPTPEPEPAPAVATPEPEPEPAPEPEPVVATPAPEPIPAPEPEPAPAVATPESTPASDPAATMPMPAIADQEAYWNSKPYLSAGNLLLAHTDLEAGKLSQAAFDSLKQKYLSTPTQLERLL